MSMRRSAVRLANALLATAATAFGCSDPPAADLVLDNGYVYTVDARESVKQAVAVRGGHIVYAGSNAGAKAYIGSKTRVIDLGGRMLMPGFVDAHLHALGGGRALLVCNLDYAPLSPAGLQAAIQSCLDATAEKEPDAWLEVVNWDRASTAALGGDPTRATLDILRTRRPITVRSTDYHTLLVNTRALQLAGITAATPDPADGHFARDAQGNPTGICEDGATWEVVRKIPPDSEEYLLAQGRTALEAFRTQGITTFRDAAAGEVQGRIFTALQTSGELTARAVLDVNLDQQAATADPAGTVAAAAAVAATYDQGRPAAAPGVHMHTVKLFLDGIVNAPADTGALLTPYFENTGTADAQVWTPGTKLGELYYDQDLLRTLLQEAAGLGLDTQMHATGERAVRTALDAVAAVREAAPDADIRPAIAHDETVAVEDYARFAALGVLPVMSFQWAQRAPYSVGETESHLGPDRFARMEPFGSLDLAGARVVFGSDWPIDPFDDILALKIGVTRAGDDLSPYSFGVLSPYFSGRINDDPALSRAVALRAITMNAAYALRLERFVGSIEHGKLADMIVLEKNFMEQPEEELARNQVLLTMVGGEVVMARGAFAGLATAPTTAAVRRAAARVPELRAAPVRAAGHGHGGQHGCEQFRIR